MNKKIYVIIMILIFMMIAINFDAAENPDYILQRVDNYRAPGNSFSSLIDIITTKNKKIIENNTMKVVTKIMDNFKNRSVGLFLKPENQKGRKILLIDTDTWLYIPGAKKSIMISPAQKLSGNASTGDILSVNFRADYNPVILGEEKVGNTETYKMELSAKTSRVTYFKILLNVSKNDYKPVKAEYYAKSGKLLKKGYFKKFANYSGKELCVEFLIVDEIFQDRITIVRYLDYKLENINDSSFNKDLLKDLNL